MRRPGGIVTLALVVGFGCGGGAGRPDAGAADAAAGPDAAAIDPSAALFDPARLLAIDIELAPADWDALRVQHPDFFRFLVEDCPGADLSGTYTVFPASVTIDGERFADVGVRMKG